jgi:regulator of replication initiation timing
MVPPSELKKEKAALLAERTALRRKVRALENENAALAVRKAELEQRLAEGSQATTAVEPHRATDVEVASLAKGWPDPGRRD